MEALIKNHGRDAMQYADTTYTYPSWHPNHGPEPATHTAHPACNQTMGAGTIAGPSEARKGHSPRVHADQANTFGDAGGETGAQEDVEMADGEPTDSAGTMEAAVEMEDLEEGSDSDSDVYDPANDPDTSNGVVDDPFEFPTAAEDLEPEEENHADTVHPMSNPPPSPSPLSTEQVISRNFLSANSFVVEKRFNRVICTACSQLVPYTRIGSHVRGAHARSIDPNTLSKSLASLGGDQPKDIPKQGIQAIDGVRVHNGWVRCHLCGHCTSSTEGMSSHLSKEHPQEVSAVRANPTHLGKPAIRELASHDISCHFTPAGGGHPSVSVLVVSADASYTSNISYMSRLAAQLKPERETYQDSIPLTIASLSAYELSPWVARVGWHTYLQGVKPQSVITAVGNSRSDAEQLVRQAVLHYCQHTGLALSKLTELIRCQLVTPEA